MKTIFGSLGFLAILLIVCTPKVSEAYFTTNQTVTKINDETALFAIEYRFGMKKYDIYMPALAERDLAWEATEKKVGYSLHEDGKEVTASGTASAIVLSSAEIVDGMYKIEKGKAEKLTLYVLLTTSKADTELDYALQVDRLPFYVDQGKADLVTQQLNPSELKYYVTDEIELNSANQMVR